MSVTVPKYQEIAADFAEKLVKGEYAPGDRVYARSTLASTYGVSAETARRAVVSTLAGVRMENREPAGRLKAEAGLTEDLRAALAARSLRLLSSNLDGLFGDEPDGPRPT